jgi:ribonuclease M5
MVKIKEAIVVEGRYDKNTVSQIVDTAIIETNGFGIFSDKEKIELLRRIAEKRGLIIFTDSDGAGFVIRGHLNGMLGKDNIKQAYIPDIYGREKRKRSDSKEGKLGVEGMTPQVIIDALKRAGATFEDSEESENSEKITKCDLFALGLSGGKNSSEERKKLMKKLNLPENMSPNALLDVLNSIYTRDEFFKAIN